MDLKLKLALLSRDTLQLKSAYEDLQRQFYALKTNFNSSHQTLEQIVMHMNDGLLFVSKVGKIVFFNAAAEDILGLSSDKMIDGYYWDYFSDSLFGFSMREILDKSSIHRRIFLNLNGEREIELSVSSIPEKGVLMLLTNCVERHKLESGRAQAERLKELGEMAATLAHEIRNPLGGIEGFAELLKRDLTDSSQQRMIGAILEGTRAINRLVTNVLDYARPLELHFEPIDLVALIKDFLNFILTAYPTLTCILKTSQAASHFSLDGDQIRQVLHNLLRNAQEAGATQIEIELAEKSLIFKDNGAGISKKNIKKIFTPFFTTKTRGTGLGLAHSLAIIKAHGGTLEIASEIGKGTRITINL